MHFKNSYLVAIYFLFVQPSPIFVEIANLVILIFFWSHMVAPYKEVSVRYFNHSFNWGIRNKDIPGATFCYW